MIAIIEKLIAAFAAFFAFVNRERERQSGRQEVLGQTQQEIIIRMKDAQNIRDDGSLPDSFLLPPAARASAGGVPGVPADISGNGRGDAGEEHEAGQQDKATQQDLGTELFKVRFKKPERWVNKVFIHCSDSDAAHHDNVETIRTWHLQRGFNDIGYHYLITKNGIVHEGRDIEKSPAAQEGYNTGSIAICLSGRRDFRAEQFAALTGLLKSIKAEIAHVTFHGHCEVNKHKTCPNFDYKKILQDV